jgi:hypothetical protein
MKVLYVLKHIKEGKEWRSKGRDVWWGLIEAGGQDGSLDSPGKGEPQEVGIMYLKLLQEPKQEIIALSSKCKCQYCKNGW